MYFHTGEIPRMLGLFAEHLSKYTTLEFTSNMNIDVWKLLNINVQHKNIYECKHTCIDMFIIPSTPSGRVVLLVKIMDT